MIRLSKWDLPATYAILKNWKDWYTEQIRTATLADTRQKAFWESERRRLEEEINRLMSPD